LIIVVLVETGMERAGKRLDAFPAPVLSAISKLTDLFHAVKNLVTQLISR
jgi:hypothetical protein